MKDTRTNSFFKLEKKQRFSILISKMVLFLVGLFLLFLVILTLEMLLYLSPTVKIGLIILLVLCAIGFITYLVKQNRPVFTENRTLKRFFGSTITEIFKNTFELIKTLKSNYYSESLTHKAIEERTQKIETFLASDDFKKKKKRNYVNIIFYIFTLVALSSIPFFIPSYNMALNRVLQPSTAFSKPLPYTVTLINSQLSAYKNENIKIQVEVKGEELPSDLSIKGEGFSEKLFKKSNTLFEYEFLNIKKSIDFQLFNDEYISPNYTVKVVEKPRILNYSITLNYPAYVGKQDEVLENQSNLLIPKGTLATIKVITEGTDLLQSEFGAQKFQNIVTNNQTQFKYIMGNQEFIHIFAKHTKVDFVDSLLIQCNVIEDEFPQIKLEISQDSLYDNILFFRGEASDDYGISNLFLNATIYDLQGKSTLQKIKLPLLNNLNRVAIDEIINIENYYTELPRKIELNVEVIDNDAVNKGKKSVSATKVIVFKTDDEKQKELNSKNETNVSTMNSMILETSKIEKELDNIKKSVQESNKKDWSIQKKMEALKKRMEELKKKMDELTKELNQINNFEKLSEEQKENKKNLEKEINDLLKKQLEEMMKAMEELLKQTNPNDIQTKLDDIKKQNENLKEDINKNVEQYKNLEFEKRFEQNISKLQEIIDKQKKLNELPVTPANKEALTKEQDEINKKFDEFQKEQEEIRKLNNSLEEPNKLENTKPEEQSIDQQLKNSSEQMKTGKEKKAKASQNKAEKEMEDLKEKLEKNKEQIEEDNLAEDIDQVRDILENLVKISMDQEKISLKFSTIKYFDPSLTELVKEQTLMKGNFEIIKDSLTAIAKRQPEVQSMVFKELNSINLNFDKISKSLFDKNISQAVVYQRYVMTSTNNLALFLAESLKKMKSKQSKMKSNSKSKKKGNNTCDNPGNSKTKKDKKGPNMEKIRKMQEGMNKKMPKPGSKPGEMGQSQSEQMARLAAEQEAIRKMLQEYLEGLKKEGKGYDGKLEKLMKEMEQTEKEIVNKNISQNTLKRQQDIVTRMLESEKAETEREKEETRESKEGNPLISPTAKYMEILKKNKVGQKEMLKKAPLPLKLYYKDKVSKYFINFGG